MTQRAHAISGQAGQWTAHEVDLEDVEDLDSFLDTLRDLDGPTVVAFVEEDDEYLGIVRLGPDDDEPRVFLSDQRALFTSPLAERLFADALPPVNRWDVEDDSDEVDTAPSPSGEPGLLTDLGTSADDLVELVAERGMLPADMISAIAERAGCVDILDDIRS